MDKIAELKKAFLHQKVDVTEHHRDPTRPSSRYSVAANDPTIRALESFAKKNELGLLIRFPNGPRYFDPPRTISIQVDQTAPGHWAITALRLNGTLQP